MIRSIGLGWDLKGLDGKGLDEMRTLFSYIVINTEQFLITR